MSAPWKTAAMSARNAGPPVTWARRGALIPSEAVARISSILAVFCRSPASVASSTGTVATLFPVTSGRAAPGTRPRAPSRGARRSISARWAAVRGAPSALL